MSRITEKVMRMGNYLFNYYVVGNRQAVIVECGVTAGVSSFASEWQLLTDKPAVNNLLAMHAHFDHVCGIPRLKEMFPQAGVLGSSEANRVLSHPRIIADFFYQDDKMSDIIVARGMLAEKPVSPETDIIQLDGNIGEGDRLKIDGDLKLHILNAPGHSPCSLAAYLPGEQVMFISDAAGFQVSETEIFPVFFQGYEVYIETIKRLMSFPIRIVAPPHGRLMAGSGVARFFQRALDTAYQVHAFIAKMLDEGVSEDEMKNRLFAKCYRGDLKIYTPENIKICSSLLIRRVKETRGQA